MKKTVLVVDDEPLNIKILAELLGDNYRVTVAKNGEQAIQRARATPAPDLILLDVMMPEMSGYQVCSYLKSCEDTWSIPIIFVSAMCQPEDRERALQAGGQG
ncbi:response regulator [Maribrevibacterium harenarium]|uniref:response regulator n=1 Tax=Maribrevibacterium harenarium TaxID=2589817 RepID=UPI001C612AD3|nr:response regulator [Maribrevibacterium harenarium]